MRTSFSEKWGTAQELASQKMGNQLIYIVSTVYFSGGHVGDRGQMGYKLKIYQVMHSPVVVSFTH